MRKANPIKLLIAIITLLSCSQLFSQSFKAVYTVTANIRSRNPQTPNNVTTISSTGQLFRKNDRYIYFETPDYLKKYPGGMIREEFDGGGYGFILSADTVQNIYYSDFDSLITRWRLTQSMKADGPPNVVQTFDSVVQNWIIFPETKK